MTRAAELLPGLETLPFATLEALIGPRPPVILVPHPDDESLGCGGLIAACCARLTPPRLIVVTDGAGSHPNSRACPPARLVAIRAREIRDAAALLGLGAHAIDFLGLPDAAAPTAGPDFEDAVAAIAATLRRTRASALLAPWRHDPHCDHVAADAMARAAAARTGVRHLAYPVWGWTLPPETELPEPRLSGHRLDIAAHLPAKQAAIAAHRSQHAGLIADDPAGFQLPERLLAVFRRPFEVFLRP